MKKRKKEDFEKYRRRKIIIRGILLTAIIILLIFDNPGDQICFKSKCFDVEIAENQEEWEKGLMFKESLDKNSGMLFVFPEEEIYSFWMKDTLIPLDIIWINADKEIVFIKRDAQPCLEEPCESFTPNEKAKYVLEMNAGMAEKVGLEIGKSARFRLR